MPMSQNFVLGPFLAHTRRDGSAFERLLVSALGQPQAEASKTEGS